MEAVQQAQAPRNRALVNILLPTGEADRFEALAKKRQMRLPELVRQLLLQKYYRGQRLAPGGNDKALARGMRNTDTLLRTLLYDEAWRLSIGARE